MSSWVPHIFRNEGESLGYDSGYLDALVLEGNRLNDLGLPVLFTVGHLAHICDVPYGLLEKVIRRKNNDHYRCFNIRKRLGGYRQITVPCDSLMRVQRWINHNILSTKTVHPSSTAFAAGNDPQKNASMHCGASWLVKLDITDFFEAISERQVYHVFRGMGYRAQLSFQLARLCTKTSERSLKYRNQRWNTQGCWRYMKQATNRLGHLPQGAPTSPMLANLVCLELDRALAELARTYDCTYSRYADDIVFSAYCLNRSQAGEIIHKASKVLGCYGLTRNRKKTHVATPGARKVVTGLLIDQQTPKLSCEYRERIEIHLYHARTKGIHGHCSYRGFRSLLGFKAHLDGLITYAEYIDTAFGKKCRDKFNALPWIE